MNFTEHESVEKFSSQSRREQRTDQIAGVVTGLILFGGLAFATILELSRWLG